jgi:alkanesulfonate monooxygenase SsuD/methylene tetrahydromethanopterin reductase-like flavin-dependent oxidoreductase (luciferase family)
LRRSARRTSKWPQGWEPIFYFPEKAASVWGAALAAGTAKRDPSLPPLDVVTAAIPLAIGEDVTGLLEFTRPVQALYIGGMGAKGRNFYNDLVARYGYEAEAAAIQEAYLAGRKEEAAALLPASLLAGTSLIGPHSQVAERVAAMRESGVTTLCVTPIAPTHSERVRLIEQLRDLAG